MISPDSKKPELLILTGATGIGKTETAVELAGQLGTEIISADSMQVYRHLSIGTAKPTPAEINGVAYHLIDHVEPNEQYNLGRFLEEATPLVEQLRSQGKLPIICGGTGLYLRGFLHGVFDTAARSESIRAELDRRLEIEGLPSLTAELRRVDPEASHIMPNDRQRILRALEVYYTTGSPISQLQTQQFSEPRYKALTIVLSRPRVQLYQRINDRVDVMLDNGLLDEVRQYLAAGFCETNPAVKALGYSELIANVRGEMELTDAVETMKRKSRRYAKRQETWFRSMKDAVWIDASELDAQAMAAQILARFS